MLNLRFIRIMMNKAYRRHEHWLMIFVASSVITAILMNVDFGLVEANFYDFRFRRGVQAEPSPEIVLITLDDTTTKALHEFSPLPLDFHAQFMEALEKLEPRAVGYLVDLHQVHQANPELFSSGWATRFAQATQRLASRQIPVLLGTNYDVIGEVIPPYPLNSLPHSVAVIHRDGNVFAEDKVTRRGLLLLDQKPAFHLELARAIKQVPPESISEILPPGHFELPAIRSSYFFFRYHGNTALIPNLRSEGPYRQYSFLDVLRGNVSPEALRGKILLVGTLSVESSSDFVYTPYSKASFSNPKILVHANILDSILQKDGIRRVPNWVNYLATFVAASLVLGFVLSSRPLVGLSATIGLIFGTMALCHLLFYQGIWLKEAPPLIGIFAGFYLSVPYRLIREYQKRWDYQRKNELLIQVEEMKTNFMRLVTHDLKTPVARIQGLAEVLLRKAAERLVDRDKETLHHIIDSTEELNHFISTILQLSQVESRRIQIKIESKDINQLIEKAVEGFKAPARAKGIRIQQNLEPLFPIRIDSSLISKVLNNLIDNALKYSPQNSEIRVESREEGPWVVVSITDQGIGMNEEERKALFTRFFRAKNELTERIKGTGLGLYLTKYFIEVHQGRVEVRSEPGQGSTFLIYLPLESGETATLPQEAPVRPGLSAKVAQFFSGTKTIAE